MEKGFYHKMFQRYITGEDNYNKLIFHVPIGSSKKKSLISVLMSLQSNTYKMTRIFVYSVAWNILCLIRENMFQRILLTCKLNRHLKVNHLVLCIGSSFPIKSLQIVLCPRASSVVVIIFFNNIK